MADNPATAAQLLKLGRLLDTDPEQLRYLESLGAEGLRKLRELASEQLFASYEDRLQRMAQASKLVPLSVALPMAEKSAPPRLMAAVAGLIETDRVVKAAPRISPQFMADLAAYLDPGRARPAIEAAPLEVARKVAKIIVDRQDLITMGNLISAVTDDALAACLPFLDDGSIVALGSVIDDRPRVDHLFGLLPDARLSGVARAATENNSWPELLGLMGDLSSAAQQRFGNVVAAQEDRVRSAVMQAASENRQLDVLTSFLDGMTPMSLTQFAQTTALAQPQLLADLASTSWTGVLRLVPYLPDEVLDRLTGLADLREPTVQAKMLADAVALNLESGILPLLPRLDGTVLAQLASQDQLQRDDVLDGFVRAAIREGQWSNLLPLVRHLPEAARKHVSELAGNLDQSELREAFASASRAGQLSSMLDVTADMPEQQRVAAVETIVADAGDEDLLGTGLPEAEQEAVWTKLLALSNGAPEQLLSQLGEQAALLQLDNVVPTVMAAAQKSGNWESALKVISSVDSTATAMGVGAAFDVPKGLLEQAAKQAQELGLGDQLGGLVSALGQGAGQSVQLAVGFAEGANALQLAPAKEAAAKVVSGLAGRLAGMLRKDDKS
ncbi:hypothetical protein FOS14_23080 [Skermania sp. ID1734]|uniref:hypothetical protein n=1 Tax=Skermania sp. ID1734 TaxID=2597516 RepID=UPI00117D6F3A|nr:hypothetical protein [Skermania sp. ID1734]TSD93439.1 hypothetical protein FOS14_23080 [Skermania sp. ID1734]